MKKVLISLTVLILCMTLDACGNSAKAPFSAENCVGQNYETVVDAFRKSGFIQIETKATEDLTSSSPTLDGDVEKVSIGGTTVFDAKAEFQNDTPVLITYHTIRKLPAPMSASEAQEHDYIEIVEMFKAAGFINVVDSEVYDLDPDDFDGDYKNEVSISGNTSFSENDLVPFDAEITVVCHRPFEKYLVKLHIDFIPNILFNKYDVVLSIDGEDKLTLEHGDDADQELKLQEGEHIFTFSEKGSHSVKGEVSLSIDCNTDVAYKISCFADDISIDTVFVDREIELAEDEAKVEASASEYKYDNYEDVLAELTASGFTNTKTAVLYDIVWGWTDEGEVKSVSIDGKTDFKRGEVFKKGAEVVVTYHMKYEDNPSTPSPTAESTLSPTIEKEAENVITAENNKTFAALLTSGYVDPDSQASFVKQYEGQIIEFDCIVYFLEQNPRYNTIYSYIFVPGEDSEHLGAALFYLEDASMFDFKWDSSTRPEYLTVGSKIRMKAEVVSGSDSLYIYLDPVCTWGRK